MSQDVRADEEAITARRAGVLGLNYVDTTKIQKQLFRTVLPLNELYSLRVIPLVADDHNIHFGITTTTSQQTISKLKARFSDQRVVFSIISDTGYRDYMKLYDPPKQIVYQDIGISSGRDEAKDMMTAVIWYSKPINSRPAIFIWNASAMMCGYAFA
jgi:hypothetical protein